MRIYADSSVYGVVTPAHPAHFRLLSERFFDNVRGGIYQLVVSDHVQREIGHPRTPTVIKVLLDEMITYYAEIVNTTIEAETLRDEYLAEGVLKPKHAADALHVAIASVAGVAILTSWDRGDIVKMSHIAGFHRVNTRLGYPTIGILLPRDL